jgi:hypothetical protein
MAGCSPALSASVLPDDCIIALSFAPVNEIPKSTTYFLQTHFSLTLADFCYIFELSEALISCFRIQNFKHASLST